MSVSPVWVPLRLEAKASRRLEASSDNRASCFRSVRRFSSERLQTRSVKHQRSSLGGPSGIRWLPESQTTCGLNVRPIPLPGVLKTSDRGVNGNRHCSTRRFSISGQTPRRTRASYWQGSTVAPGRLRSGSSTWWRLERKDGLRFPAGHFDIVKID